MIQCDKCKGWFRWIGKLRFHKFWDWFQPTFCLACNPFGDTTLPIHPSQFK